jgi:cellulose synthase/poly-beta-1,6-N-acetylglucosamine synthase-like glycosyltransferase
MIVLAYLAHWLHAAYLLRTQVKNPSPYIKPFKKDEETIRDLETSSEVASDRPLHTTEPRLTVVVPCRNEAQRIGPLLDTLSSQTLVESMWEVVFVDDESTDATASVIARWMKSKPQVRARLLSGPKPGGKKTALAAGIATARSPVILTTDADCRAAPGWLAEMAAPFDNPSVQFAIGLVLYESDGSLLQDVQRIESMGLVSLGAAAALGGQPYLANGANFAFRRAAFDAVGGYRYGGQLASGDDTFLLEEFCRAQLAGACVWSTQALVWTQAAPNWRAYWQQNIRWLSKAKASRNRQQKRLQVVGLLVWGSWWPLVIGLLVSGSGAVDLSLLLAATVLRMLADGLLTRPLRRLAGLRLPWRNWLLGQLVYAAWAPAVALRALVGGHYTWRDRRLR